MSLSHEPEALEPDERPDEQQIVIEAVEVAAQRGLPLAVEPGALGVGSTPDSRRDAPPVARSTLPRQTPWGDIPVDAFEQMQNVDIMRSLAAIAPRMTLVETEIEKLITTPIKLIADIAFHTLGAGGKRLRPALTLLAAQLCGDDGETPNPRVVTCAAAIELTHTTTLLHDDVVDDADTRRGQPTARLLWGNETSVLVGDYLFTQVFVTASQKGFGELVLPLAQATAQMCAGVLLETQTRGYLEMSEKQYREIIALKTAALTECACRLGALAMNAPEDKVNALAQFGHDIGLAFQIVDDVLDITAEQTRIGKPVGHDLREGDVTLPMLRAMQVCNDDEKAILKKVVGDAISKEAVVQENEVQAALEILRGCDAIEYSLQLAHNYIASGKSQLEHFPDIPARAMLLDISDYVMSREK
jgi:geranylgeranyl pyrophosphate synthase